MKQSPVTTQFTPSVHSLGAADLRYEFGRVGQSIDHEYAASAPSTQQTFLGFKFDYVVADDGQVVRSPSPVRYGVQL